MWTTGVKTALIVVCAFFVFQQITGINVPLYYGPKLLGPLFQAGSSKVAATMAGVEVTAIIAAVNVIATYFAFRWIDRIGRRKLAMGGYAGMCAAALISAPGLLLSGLPRIILVMIALNAFVASFAIGVGGTGWLIQGEVSRPGSVGRPQRSVRAWTGSPTLRSSRCFRPGRRALAWAGSWSASLPYVCSPSRSSTGSGRRRRIAQSRRSPSCSRSRRTLGLAREPRGHRREAPPQPEAARQPAGCTPA